MCPVDEGAGVVGRTVEARGGEGVDAVVPPAEIAGEFCDRHDLEERDAEPAEFRQLVHRGPPGSFAREGAKMHLIYDQFSHRTAAPALVGPDEAGRIHHGGRQVRPFRLKARDRIGECAAVDANSVARPRVGVGGEAREITVVLLRQRMKRGRLCVGQKFNGRLRGIRRPHAKMNASTRLDLGADRQTAPRRRRLASQPVRGRAAGIRGVMNHDGIPG